MTSLLRMRVGLTGFIGEPGVSTFYFRDVQTAGASLRNLWVTIASMMPQGAIVTIPNAGDTINDQNGDIDGQWSGEPVAPIPAGGGLERYAGGTGACVTWITGGLVASHRVRGRTFAVPLTVNAFDTNGSLDNTYRGLLAVAATSFIFEQSLSAVVWSRPFAGSPQVGIPGTVGYRAARPARSGSNHIITSSVVADKAAILRSRRD